MKRVIILAILISIVGFAIVIYNNKPVEEVVEVMEPIHGDFYGTEEEYQAYQGFKSEAHYGAFKTKEEYEKWLKIAEKERQQQVEQEAKRKEAQTHKMSPEMKEAWRKLLEMAEKSQQRRAEIHQRAIDRAERFVAATARRYTEEEMDEIIEYFEQKEYEQLYLEGQR